jgi:hypothetical protein
MNNEPSSIKNRIWLFLATYLAGVIIFEVITMIQLRDFPNSMDDLLRILFLSILSTVFLLGGLFQALVLLLYRAFGVYPVDLIVTDMEQGSCLGLLFAGLSYVIFLGIVRAAFLTKSQRTFQLFYYIFIGLLVITIGGCTVGLR